MAVNPKSRIVTVRLTVAQVDALESLLAYASAGGPEDVGMECSAWNRLDSAWVRLAAARVKVSRSGEGASSSGR